MEVRRVWPGFWPSVSTGSFDFVGLGVLERWRERLDGDREGEVDGDKRGGGDEGPEADSDTESASGRSERGIFVNSEDVADGTRCSVEQAKVLGGSSLDTGAQSGSGIGWMDEDDGIGWVVEGARAVALLDGNDTDICGIWPWGLLKSCSRAVFVSVSPSEKLMAFIIDAKGDPGGARVIPDEAKFVEAVTQLISSRR
jgi:hypothetical protein